MTNIELALTNLGEAAAVEFHQSNNSQGLEKLKEDMNKSGTVLKKAKKEIEKELGRTIVTSDNYLDLIKNEEKNHLE
jgi:DNA-damage-inducible protein D